MMPSAHTHRRDGTKSSAGDADAGAGADADDNEERSANGVSSQQACGSLGEKRVGGSAQ